MITKSDIELALFIRISSSIMTALLNSKYIVGTVTFLIYFTKEFDSFNLINSSEDNIDI